MKLSVICPILNEEQYIVSCIESVLKQDYPKQDMEVLFVDGMSVDATRRIILEYSTRYPFFRLLDNPLKTAPCAMNIGIKEAKGEIVLRIDAHTNYADNYFSCLCRYLVELNADNVGAVCRTEVLHKNARTLAIREVLCHRFGVGNSVFRTGTDKIQRVDTVPFGCYHRSLFDRIGFYDERLTRNQDFELNRRILHTGGSIYIVPDTYAVYYARETFSALWKQNYQNGLWGIRTVLFTGNGDSLALRHYIPCLFLLSLIFPTLVGFFWTPSFGISMFSLCMYLLVLLGVVIPLSFRKKLNAFYLLVSFLVLHISNGTGMLVSVFTAKSYVNKINRYKGIKR